MKKIKVPKKWPVQPLKPGQPARDRCTCGSCGLSWDDSISTSLTPAPSARCPFEAFHNPEPSVDLLDLLSKALPYVEDAESDPAYKSGVVKKLAKQIREAIE